MTRGLVWLIVTLGIVAALPSAGWAQGSGPVNGRIYYDENELMVSVLPDGSERRLIGRGGAATVDPTGTRLAFERDKAVWLADADGSDARRLTPAGVEAHNPDWSPDGKRLVYVRNNGEDGWMDIHVTDPAGETSINLTLGSAAYDADPSWSADGRHVAFVSDRVGWFQLYRVPADGSGEPTRLTATDGQWSQFPDWEPGGDRIAFIHDFNNINAVPAAGGPMTLLVEDAVFPAWSPDGRQLAFARGSDLWVRGADGEEHPLTTTEAGVTLSDWSVVRDLPDGDGDLWPDGNDNCPFLANSDQADRQQDGVGDACREDVDSDSVLNEKDNCPDVPNADQKDTDKDGLGDACDPDRDGDQIANTTDNCPDAANANQKDTDKDGLGDTCDPDRDGDQIANTTDNCPDAANANQKDTDKDGLGDTCDPDRDGDQIANTTDNCPDAANANQKDTDKDGLGDACDPDRDGDQIANTTDNCPDAANADQKDTDSDRIGNACDPDRDGDQIANTTDNCPDAANADQKDTDSDRIGNACDPDRDGDQIANTTDNCPDAANADQKDTDGDRIGNACDPDRDGDQIANTTDNCPDAANADQKDTDGDRIGDACDPTPLPSGGTAGSTETGGTQQQPPPPPAQQQQPPPPPPEFRETVTVAPLRGRVTVRRPGRPPRELKEGETIPVGSIVDARAGALTLTAEQKGGGTATSEFYAGIFKIAQDARGFTELRLVEELSCPSRSAKARGAAAKKVGKRELWGRGTGKFRTRGNFAAATVRGTWWQVADTCTTTTTRVREGRVSVRDFSRRRTVIVRAGGSYVARRP